MGVRGEETNTETKKKRRRINENKTKMHFNARIMQNLIHRIKFALNFAQPLKYMDSHIRAFVVVDSVR